MIGCRRIVVLTDERLKLVDARPDGAQVAADDGVRARVRPDAALGRAQALVDERLGRAHERTQAVDRCQGVCGRLQQVRHGG